MSDYYHPRKAVVIAGSRVGSMMLCNALDSHPQISCERTEPLNPATSVYLREGLTPEQTLRIVLSRPGFHWAMCKVSYRQLVKQISLTDLQAWGVEKIIHLWRENVLRVVVSAALNTSAWRGEREHPTHAWQTPDISRITIDPQLALGEALRYIDSVHNMQEWLIGQKLPVLELTYEEQVGAFKNELEDPLPICHFLGVEGRSLKTLTQPVNPYPLCEIVENWQDFRAVFIGTEFERWLE